MIKLVAAVDDDWGIGRHGTIPWYLPEDLRRFSKLTTDQHVIMGRKTAESISKGLPNRTSWVVTSQAPFSWEDPCRRIVVRGVRSLEEALFYTQGNAWVIGGQLLYEEALPIAPEVYLTHVSGRYDCDRFFPRLSSGWQLVWEEAHPGYRFSRYTAG